MRNIIAQTYADIAEQTARLVIHIFRYLSPSPMHTMIARMHAETPVQPPASSLFFSLLSPSRIIALMDACYKIPVGYKLTLGTLRIEIYNLAFNEIIETARVTYLSI